MPQRSHSIGATIYSLNGYPLDDLTLGWLVTGSSDWTTGTNIERTSLTTPGYDGSVIMPGRQVAPALGLTIATPYRSLPALVALLTQPELAITQSGKPGSARVLTDTSTPTRVGHGDAENTEFSVTVVLTIPGVWYRGQTETFDVPLDAATKTVPVFPGLSGKVGDALVRLTDVTDPKVRDSAGSWWTYTGVIPAGSYLRFDATSGKAWMTTTDAWTGGTEVDSLSLSFGPRPGFLNITPEFTLTPATRRGKLSVSTASRGDTAAVNVRGRNAYVA
ncbi:hypothetical protein [Cryobacterium sp. PH31-O1]|uniref:hypothetical protein n=1 Tax=Cryobacterium sp. PH31-O1 TaxID=3046306 RepID=UPI0024B98925|nr:hypothetical protein [Cryobacterium sp. PH31-O1]MDJ0338268.1 hypothetical protein [Cryobacterium sp. PH31-O1]